MASDQSPVNANVISSAPALSGELTVEERKERLEKIRRQMTMTPLSVTPPSGWMCRWARTVDEVDIAKLEFKGYQIVHDDPKNPRYKLSARCREDGTYRVGDVILMEVPLEVWEFLRDQEKEQGRMMIEGASEEFIEQARSQGVPTFERDASGRVIKKHK